MSSDLAVAVHQQERTEPGKALSLPHQPTWIFAPTNATEALAVADMLSRSNLIPESFRGKPGDVLIALQMGAEVGLAPMQALQGIAVINGRPSIWGDTLIGLVRAHKSVHAIEETLEGTGDARVATCRMSRAVRGAIETTVRTFSWKDATTAGLAKKAGPWTQYPDRMLQMRARGFCLRDGAADILKGLAVVEEAMDLGPAPVTAVYDRADSKSGTVANALAARAQQLDAPKVEPEPAALTVPDFASMEVPAIAELLTEKAQELGVPADRFSKITAEFGGKLNRGNARNIYDRIVAVGAEIAAAPSASADSISANANDSGRLL